jgi:hypothetical protein
MSFLKACNLSLGDIWDSRNLMEGAILRFSQMLGRDQRVRQSDASRYEVTCHTVNRNVASVDRCPFHVFQVHACITRATISIQPA